MPTAGELRLEVTRAPALQGPTEAARRKTTRGVIGTKVSRPPRNLPLLDSCCSQPLLEQQPSGASTRPGFRSTTPASGPTLQLQGHCRVSSPARQVVGCALVQHCRQPPIPHHDSLHAACRIKQGLGGPAGAGAQAVWTAASQALSGYVWLQHIARCMTAAACFVEGYGDHCSALGAGATLRTFELCAGQPAVPCCRPECPIWHAEGASA